MLQAWGNLPLPISPLMSLHVQNVRHIGTLCLDSFCLYMCDCCIMCSATQRSEADGCSTANTAAELAAACTGIIQCLQRTLTAKCQCH